MAAEAFSEEKARTPKTESARATIVLRVVMRILLKE
jgi:hypothetical protein